MRRVAMIAVASLVAGACTCRNFRQCSSDGDCTAASTCVDGFCVVNDAGGAGGGSAGGGATGGGIGGASGGATGGGSVAPGLTGLQWRSPDGGTTAATSLPLVVATLPAGFDAGPTLAATLSAPDGGTTTRTLLAMLPGIYGGASTPPLTDGVWRAFVAKGAVDASIDFVVDVSGPALFVVPPQVPDYGTNVVDFIPSDPTAPGFRKDESILVRVTTADTDLATVSLSARFGSLPEVQLPAPTMCGVGCREFTVDLSRIDMPALAGDVVFTATGSDLLGNAQRSSDAGAIRITRWQWARRPAPSASFKATPAIGTGGRLFVGVAGTGPSTGVAALEADGGLAWPVVLDGPVAGPVAVGRGATGEHVFFQPSTGTSTGTLRAVAAPTGVVEGGNCPGGSSMNVNEGGVAIFGENTAAVGAFGVQAANSASRGNVLLPEGPSCRDSAPSTVNRVQSPGNLVTTSTAAVMVGSNGNLRVFDFNGNQLTLRSGVDQPVGTSVGVVTGLAMLSGTRVAGGGPGIGRLFAFDLGAGSVSGTWDAGVVLSTPTSGPVVGSSGVFAVLRSPTDRARVIRVGVSDGVELARTADLSTSTVQSAFSGNSVASPGLGATGKVYVVDEAGSLFVVAADFAPDAGAQWGAGLPSAVAGAVSASPTLDCNRRRPASQTGVLYLATETGWIVSYLVDSPLGLDPTAPWPKYARDSRNTGNFNGPAIACP